MQHSTFSNQNPKGWIIIGVLSLFVALGFNVPWLPANSAGNLDASWIMALHEAFANNMQFGQEIVWHYGPLGFLYERTYNPETYTALLIGWAGFTLIFWLAAFHLAYTTKENPLIPVIAALIIIFADDAFFIAFSLCLLLHYYFINTSLKSLIFWLLVITSALAGLVKFSYLLAGFGIVCCIEISRIWERKAPLLILGTFIATFVLGWMLTGQHISNIGPHLYGAFEHGSGFVAMAKYDRSAAFVLLYLIGWLLLIGLIGSVMWQRQQLKSLPFIAGLFFLMLISIKTGFIRNNDHHMVQAIVLFMLLAIFAREYFWDNAPKLGRIAFASFAALIIGLAVFQTLNEKSGTKGEVQNLLKQTASLSSKSNSIDEMLSSIFSLKQTNFEKTRGKILERYALPKLDGTVDLYNYHQSLIFSGNYNYSPRPVIQSYHSYTPYLAQLNRDHLTSPNAPDHIFFAIQGMLDRFPTVDDAISWPLLLTHYDVKGVYSSYLHLEKAKPPRKHKFTPISTHTITLGEIIKVPFSQNPIWVSINVKNTLLGWLAEKLFKNVPIYIKFRIGSYERQDRIVQATARDGFLLSPLIDNTLHFALLAREGLLGLSRIDDIAITVPKNMQFWANLLLKDSIEVAFSEFTFPIRYNSTIKNWDSVGLLADLSHAAINPIPIAKSREVMDRHVNFSSDYNNPSLKLHGDTELILPLQPENKMLQFHYGLFKPYQYVTDISEGATFTISGIRNGTKTLLWQNTLQALQTNKASINFPQSTYSLLTLSVSHKNPDTYNWAFWRKMELQ